MNSCARICLLLTLTVLAIVQPILGLPKLSAQTDASAPAVSTPSSVAQPDPDSPPIVPTLDPVTSAVQPSAAPPSPFAGSLLERSKLVGDPTGMRSQLLANGISADFSNTQYFQGDAAGGLQRAFEYGGRNDLFINVNGEKAGLWKGVFVDVHGEERYGEAVNSLTGTMLPPNLMLSLPQPKGSTPTFTAVKVTQFLSESFLVYAGKINALDGFTQPLTGATGVNGFMNTSLMFNPIWARTVPYSSWGAGFAYLKDLQPVLTVAVFDTNNTPMTTGFDTFFNNGMTIFSQLNLPTQFLQKPGHQGITGTYNSGTHTTLQPTPYFSPVTGGLVIPTNQASDSWSMAYNFDQALFVSPTNPKQMWGVFGNLGIADEDPSPLRWFSSAGISGTSPIQTRPNDSFGIGYSYTGISDRLKQFAPVVLPLQNEQALELYYNVAVTRWFHLTPDIQVLDPFLRSSSQALVIGTRAKIDF